MPKKTQLDDVVAAIEDLTSRIHELETSAHPGGLQHSHLES